MDCLQWMRGEGKGVNALMHPYPYTPHVKSEGAEVRVGFFVLDNSVALPELGGECWAKREKRERRK